MLGYRMETLQDSLVMMESSLEIVLCMPVMWDYKTGIVDYRKERRDCRMGKQDCKKEKQDCSLVM